MPEHDGRLIAVLLENTPYRHFFTIFGHIQLLVDILFVLEQRFQEGEPFFWIERFEILQIWWTPIFNYKTHLIIIREMLT